MEHKGTKVIETERLTLRPFRLEDAEAMFRNWASDPEVTKFLTWFTHGDVNISRQVLEVWVSCYAEPSYYQWAIELKEIHEPIGSISAVRVNDKTESATIGYCIGRSFWGRGITAEALSAVIAFFFDQVGMNCVNACHDPHNPNSGKVMRKSGMTWEGTWRAGGINNQGRCDESWYSILKEEYDRRGDSEGIYRGRAEGSMNEEIFRHYLGTSIYTYAGEYKDFMLSLPDDPPSIGRWVCDQITHPSMYFTEPSPYLEDAYFGKFSSYPKHRFKNEDELYITAVSMLAGILYLDETGFAKNKDVTKRITVSCRQASVLFSAILKAKGIPCRSRAGFMDFGDAGESYMEHWINEYWDFGEGRWVLADVDGYYEYEERFGYSQFDLPRRKFVTASEAWLGLRKHTLDKKLDVFTPNLLDGVCEYLFMDFHALMNNEIFYSYQPLYIRNGTQALGEPELYELDHLAELLKEPDENLEQIKDMWNHNDKMFVLTNNTQNIYQDVFR